MGKFKHYKGDISGGVDISHKSKISGKAKNLMSFPGGMPGPGEYGSMNNKVVGKGMMKYMAGEPVGMAKYKSNAQRKAAHASMAEQGAGKYGKHKGAAQAKPDYIDIDGDGNKTESMKQAADGMGKYGHKKGPAKKKYIQDKEGKIEGKAKRIIGSGTKKILASRDKKEVGKKYKSSGPGNFFSTTGSDKPKEKENKSMSDAEKIKASKTKKETAGNKKKAEGQADLKTAKEMKFISRGSGEDSGIATREERRKAIRAARAKKRAGRKEARKARKKTVIKQKI